MVSKPPLSLVIFAYFLYFLSFSEAQTNVTTTTTIQTTSTPVNCDTENQFKCKGENTCIPVEWVCDYVNDCKNGEDEENCSYLHYCLKGNFLCRSGDCIEADMKCDGVDNCSDRSDEKFCPPGSIKPPSKKFRNYIKNKASGLISSYLITLSFVVFYYFY